MFSTGTMWGVIVEVGRTPPVSKFSRDQHSIYFLSPLEEASILWVLYKGRVTKEWRMEYQPSTNLEANLEEEFTNIICMPRGNFLLFHIYFVDFASAKDACMV